MKKQLFIILVMLMAIPLQINADNVCGDGVTFSYDRATQTLTISKTGEGTGAMYDYFVFDKGYKHLDRPWYGQGKLGECYEVEHVVIEEGVTTVGRGAFEYMDYISSVVIPNSVTTIGNSAFCGCNRLESITIPEGVTTIEGNAFNNCGFTSLTFSKNVTSIGIEGFGHGSYFSPFLGCDKLASIIVEEGNPFYDSRDNCNAIVEKGTNTLLVGCKNTIIPNTVNRIEFDAFFGCTDLQKITIPKNVTRLYGNSFEYCYNLSSVVVESGNPVYDSRNNCNAIIETSTNQLVVGSTTTFIPESVTSIGNGAFAGRRGLKSISIPNTVVSIGQGAFSDCDITSIVIPNSVKSIGSYAFQTCYNLKSVTLSNQIDAINEQTFWGCSELTSITIPLSVKSVGERAFGYCSHLSSVTIYSPSLTTYGYLAFQSNSKDRKIYVPAGSVETYKAGWPDYANDILPIGGSTLDPIDNADFGKDIDDNTNLDGNVVGNIYYNITSGNGSYNAAEGCIVVTKPTDDSAIDGQDIFGEDFKDNYTGIVFKVPAGKGAVTVEAQTSGSMMLKVKIGNNDPIEMMMQGKMKVKIPYEVAVPTYVYIYAGSFSSQARDNRAGTADGELKLYSLEVSNESNGIDEIDNGKQTMGKYYTLDGRRVDGLPAKKGIYIVNGRKVVVK